MSFTVFYSVHAADGPKTKGKAVKSAPAAPSYGNSDSITEAEVRIYDYVDGEVPALQRMFNKRLRGYRAMGYAIADADDATTADLPIAHHGRRTSSLVSVADR